MGRSRIAENDKDVPPGKLPGRYRPLPAGTHGLERSEVQDDQSRRLRQAMVELIAAKGYAAVRIVDLARLARVSQPTFYELFSDKEDLFVSSYQEVAERTGVAVIGAYATSGSHVDRLSAAIAAFAELAASQPEATSLLVLGAFGAGPKAVERRAGNLAELERRILALRSAPPGPDATRGPDEDVAEESGPEGRDMTVRFILGGLREVAAARLSSGRASELPRLAGEMAAWAASYPRHLPPAILLGAGTTSCAGMPGDDAADQPRAKREAEPLPGGRSETPRPLIRKSQQERIIDATAAIVAEKGLSGLTIPEIARRAKVSHQTFYEIYPSKHDAFLGAQKVGLHQALQVGGRAWQERMPDWPAAVEAGIEAVVAYLIREPDHAHLAIVDTFGASPETIVARQETMDAFAGLLAPGHDFSPPGVRAPGIAAEAVIGGLWQLVHQYAANHRLEELPPLLPQLTYLALCAFLGPEAAAAAVLS
jgi:AcrR family transcriptional regulator